MIRYLLFLLALAAGLGLPHARAATAQSSYESGVTALRSGDAEAAATHLAASLESGGRHPAVYHALGNALYRSGERGHATAAWRRAAHLAPRNGDIQANLDRVRREAEDRLDPSGAGPFIWQRLLSPAESAWLASLLAALGLAAAATRTWARRRGSAGPAVGAETFALMGLSLLLATGTAFTALAPPGAVVVAPETSALSKFDSGVELFILHAGAEVTLVEVYETHALVALPDERKGWLPLDALVSVDPAAPFPLPAP